MKTLLSISQNGILHAAILTPLLDRAPHAPTPSSRARRGGRLVGLTLAALGADVLVTELDAALPLLRANVAANAALFRTEGSERATETTGGAASGPGGGALAKAGAGGARAGAGAVGVGGGAGGVGAGAGRGRCAAAALAWGEPLGGDAAVALAVGPLDLVSFSRWDLGSS